MIEILFLSLVLSLLSPQLPSQTLDGQQTRAATEMTGDSLPHFYRAFHFFLHGRAAAERGEDSLKLFLRKYGIPTPSSARDTFLREAEIAMSLHQDASDRAGRMSAVLSTSEYQQWRRDDMLATAEEVGTCFGRFLAEIRREGGRQPANFEDLLRVRLAPNVKVGHSDHPDAGDFFKDQDLAFRRGVDEALR